MKRKNSTFIRKKLFYRVVIRKKDYVSKIIGLFEVSKGKLEFQEIYFRFHIFDSNLFFSNKKFKLGFRKNVQLKDL